MLSETKEEYQAYILRIWRHSPDLPWQVMLEPIPSGERQGFPSLDKAFDYLKASANSENHIPADIS